MFRRIINRFKRMERSLEDTLFQAIMREDYETVSRVLSEGANPNKTVCHGKTCLGEAAYVGNTEILKMLIVACKSSISTKISYGIGTRKRHTKTQKRKLKLEDPEDETVVKCKSLNERTFKDYCNSIGVLEDNTKADRNQGYYVIIHNDGSSSDENRRANLRSPISMTSSPADLEWDEEIGTVAPTTTEDETWSSMYKWYAAILECTGAAIASASGVSNGIDQQDAYMRTALHYAAEQGHAGAAQLLLDAGCKIDVTAGDGLTALHVAVVKNNLNVVQVLLAAGSNVNYKTHEKMTPLHFAASRGFMDVVKVLVNNGAYVEARDTNERTALYLAAGRGHLDVVTYFVNSGANVNGEEIHGYTPLCEAVWQRYAPVVKLLLSSGARITHSHKLLHNAIIQRQDEIVNMLSNYGGGINLHNDNGDTPLLLAARLAQHGVARLLLQKGANVNSCNSITGANALHIGVESIEQPEDFEELLKCLLEYDIDMNTTALTGDTALNRALLLHKDHAAILLIRHGADVNTCDLNSCGLDNLSIASRRRSCTLANFLIKAGHFTPAPEPDTNFCNPDSSSYWIYNTCKQPLSLADISRIRIRQMSTTTPLFTFVTALPLPWSLKSFLMMENE